VDVVGVGVDAVDVGRLRRVLERRPGLVDRLFTPGERDYARNHGDAVTRLAVRYAAKEAAMKALGVGLGAFPFPDVEVQTNEAGAPSLNVTGAAKKLADERGVAGWQLSLTHTATTAIAVVLALGS
jgi:holo-[acyl-carrier protein] synthase